jgi:formylglycine-generating enzyme required for sulfatase activity
VSPVDESAAIDVEVMVPSDPTVGMTRLDSRRYDIGLPVSEASFYNQTPRFSRQIDDLWIDSLPVTEADFARALGGAPPAGHFGFKTGVTFAEAAAYCRSVGKRLPTEVEWEAAFTSVPLEAQPSILEWTSSWYEAYPGNDRVDEAYGKWFRVIRASSGSHRDRRYMAPNDRDQSVGFRCVLSIPRD